MEPGTPRERVFNLQLGHLSPITEKGGVKERLANLGFECGDREDSLTTPFVSALRAFQQKYQLPATGELNAATRDKLKEVHGS